MTDPDDLGARFGLHRAPGEGDDNYRRRLEMFIIAKPRFTKHDIERACRSVSWLVRRVVIENPEVGTVVIRARGPMGIWLPRRIRDRVPPLIEPQTPLGTLVKYER